MDESARRTTATSTGATDQVHDAWVAHHERLWRSVLAWSGDRDIASDAVAEAFAQAARRGAAIDEVGRWVWRAAFRIAGGLLADRRRHNGGPAPELADRAAVPGEALALVDALAQLSDDDRTVVVLSLIGGWSSAEAGRLLGAGPGLGHRGRATETPDKLPTTPGRPSSNPEDCRRIWIVTDYRFGTLRSLDMAAATRSTAEVASRDGPAPAHVGPGPVRWDLRAVAVESNATWAE